MQMPNRHQRPVAGQQQKIECFCKPDYSPKIAFKTRCLKVSKSTHHVRARVLEALPR